MIQRVQSVYLLITAFIAGILFYIPLFELPQGAEEQSKTFLVTSNAFLFILNSLIGGLGLVTIFLFRKRQLQMKASRLNLLFVFLLVGLLFYTSDTLTRGLDQKILFRIGTYLPLIQVVLLFLAHRSIKKDDELVKSADRLRG